VAQILIKGIVPRNLEIDYTLKILNQRKPTLRDDFDPDSPTEDKKQQSWILKPNLPTLFAK
jgi:hypothetical protein